MNKPITNYFLIFTCLFTSCIFNSSSTELVNGYDLSWIDSKWNQSIYKGEEQIPGYIFNVGYNEKFIIAKQHPLEGDFYSEPNYEITNFYIIDMEENDSGYKKGVIGPLSESQFYNMLDNYGIKDKLKFTIVE